MVLITEIRIPLPLSVEEYRIAQLYTIAKFSTEATKDGEGVRYLVNEPFENEHGKGQYTHKEILVDGHIPGWLRFLLPANLVVEEKSWNAYPYTKSSYYVPFLGERFSMCIETKYEDDAGASENILKLSKEVLKDRVVQYIDILKDEQQWFKGENDVLPSSYHSEKTGRGPLKEGWQNTSKPIMCSYKLVTIEFKYWGLQTKVESYVIWAMSQIFLSGHRKVFCWMDEWYGMSLEDIRKFEEETTKRLEALHKDQAAEN